MDASLAVGIVGSLLTILAIWLGIIRVELDRPWRFITVTLELAVLAAGLYFLGPVVGPALAFGAVTGWFLLNSIRLAMQYDTLATDAAIHWRISRDEAKTFIRDLVKSEGRPRCPSQQVPLAWRWGLCVAWSWGYSQLEAMRIVVEEVAEEFGGEDPAVPDVRHMLDHTTEQLVDLHENAQTYVEPFELGEPSEEDVAAMREQVERELEAAE